MDSGVQTGIRSFLPGGRRAQGGSSSGTGAAAVATTAAGGAPAQHRNPFSKPAPKGTHAGGKTVTSNTSISTGSKAPALFELLQAGGPAGPPSSRGQAQHSAVPPGALPRLALSALQTSSKQQKQQQKQQQQHYYQQHPAPNQQQWQDPQSFQQQQDHSNREHHPQPGWSPQKQRQPLEPRSHPPHMQQQQQQEYNPWEHPPLGKQGAPPQHAADSRAQQQHLRYSQRLQSAPQGPYPKRPCTTGAARHRSGGRSTSRGAVRGNSSSVPHLLGRAREVRAEDPGDLTVSRRRAEDLGFNYWDDGAGDMDDAAIGLSGAPQHAAELAWEGVGRCGIGPRTMRD